MPSTITPDPKPLTKRQQAAEAKRLAKLAEEQTPSETAAALFGSGQTISQISLTIEKSHKVVRELLTEAGVDFSADKNALGIEDRVRTASAATLARREANAADKAKVSEQKKADREARDASKRDLVSQVVKRYEATGSVKEVAEMTTNATTGKPYSTTRIMRILADAGVLSVTKRGDTSERDNAIVKALMEGAEPTNVAGDHGLSLARVRSIAKKGGVEIAGATRGGKLPEQGTPEWDAFKSDVDALVEKYGVALGTMAHAIRKAS